MKILVWGAGNMSQAFVKGLKNKNSHFEFFVFNPTREKAERLAGAVQGQVVTENTASDYDLVILGFKPQKLSVAAAQLCKILPPQTAVLSLLAATEISKLATYFPQRPLVRVMTNLTVERNSGIVLWAAQRADESFWQKVFVGLGLARLVNEKEMDVYTLHAGCSPAFIYQWIKDAGVFAATHGADEALARELFIHALSSALEGIRHDHSNLSEKINSVASKGGVTEAALKRFHELSPQYVEDGFLAGLKRIGELKS